MSDIARRLVAVNREFYQTLAAPFDSTRGRVQPGVQRLLERVSPDGAVADLGCGNGNAARFLAGRGFHGRYAGFDLSPALLEIARAGPYPFSVSFQRADFSEEGWDRPIPEGSFDAILAFAVLHHIPGEEGRLAFLRACRRLIAPQGSLFLSTWRFDRREKLRGRIAAWSQIGLADSDVDPGDYLLDWRHEGSGLRYVHLIDDRERGVLAARASFAETEFFQSDGKEGNLADYAVWAPS
jgi:tRNA (uracil-5-)-methyltransferase TRM9